MMWPPSSKGSSLGKPDESHNSHHFGINPKANSSFCHKPIKTYKYMQQNVQDLLQRCMSKEQTTFLKGRQITDNIILGREWIKSIGQSKKKRAKLCAIKLDILKAFDRLEWDYIIKFLNVCRFLDKWYELVYNCISYTSMSVLVNGKCYNNLKPLRGILYPPTSLF